HVKLKLRAGQPLPEPEDDSELSAAAILATPRCHPDGAAIRRGEKKDASRVGYAVPSDESRDRRMRVTFDALGWHMADRLRDTPLLAGDPLAIAFSVGKNDHPEYGGLELSLRDFKVPA